MKSSLRRHFARENKPDALSSTHSTTESNPLQARLLALATAFVLLYAVILSLAPAGRERSWEAGMQWGHWLGVLLWAFAIWLLHQQIRRQLPGSDPYLFPTAALLSGWGMLTIWRLFPAFGLRQSLWFAVAAGAVFLGLRLPAFLVLLQRYKYVWLTSGLALTALTLIFGANPIGYGPRLWLGCCGFYFQPSEPLKLLLVVYLAAYLAQRLPAAEKVEAGEGLPWPLLPLLAPTLLLTGLALLLLFFQRDLGTASIFLFLYAVVVYIASRRTAIVLAGGLTLLTSAIVGYAAFDIVRLRIDAWLNPWLDPSGRSYQIVQSLLAIANGGILGRGPGLGNPGLVPIPHSDFVFASIVEETGLVGGLGLLLLVALLAARGIRTALRATSAFDRYLASGLTAYLVGQSVLIIGGNTRLLPLTGVTLPLVSYGGTSLLTSWIAVLALLHISNQQDAEMPPPLPQGRTILQLAALLLAGLGAAALTLGWWSVYRGPDLLTRSDNPRRGIADRYVRRGSILDRRNQPLAATSGNPGEYTRQILYPPLSPVIGYTNPIYGQAGLEASLDAYLRGLQGNPGLSIWWNHLLYGQPPPGLDVRLTLDLQTQQAADQAFGDLSGGLVLLEAESGEILAMVSHPGFDANQLEAQWSNLITDPSAPLINRAVMGRYPVDELLGNLPPVIATNALEYEPQLRLPPVETPAAEEGVYSPLQLALVAAALSNNGVRPAPILVQAIKTPQAGWVLLPPLDQSARLFAAEAAQAAISRLSESGQALWQIVGVAENRAGGAVTWYLGGALPSTSSKPLALALLLEQDDLEAAIRIGQSLLQMSRGQ